MVASDSGLQLASLLVELETVIESRRGGNPAESYVADLLGQDEDRLLKKVGEEAIEVILAARSGEKASISAEAADLLFHLMVLLARYDLGLKDVVSVLESRLGHSGIAEKALRSQRDSS